jgi:hypothetical protein
MAGIDNSYASLSGRDILGTTFFRAESSLIQSSCRSLIRVIVPYERGYETSGSPLRFMLRRSSLVECVSVLPGNRALKKVVPNISRPKKSRHFLMKLPDNFHMREYLRPCRFQIILDTEILLELKQCKNNYVRNSGYSVRVIRLNRLF